MIADIIAGTLAFLAPVGLAVLAIGLSGGLRQRRRRRSINDRLLYWQPRHPSDH